jgi:HEAT repeat protein
MGLFDFFSSSEDAQIKRHAKRVRNLNAQADDRQASAYWLAENGTEEAIVALLGRFTINYEQHMKDRAEKQIVRDLLVELGVRSSPPIRAWVRKNENFAIPLQVIEEVEGEGAVVDVLLDLLGREVDPFKPEKKRQILVKLAEFLDQRIIDRVPACLEDFDEGIRYAAAETLLAQDTDEVQQDLAKALANRSEESNRLRVRIAEAFHKRSWGLGDHIEAIAERPPVGWQVLGDKVGPA